jgi:hypothetical protein
MGLCRSARREGSVLPRPSSTLVTSIPPWNEQTPCTTIKSRQSCRCCDAGFPMRGQGYAAYVLEGALLDKSLQAIPDVAHSRRASWSLPFSEIHSLHALGPARITMKECRVCDLTDVIDPIGPSGYLMRSTVARNDPVLINLHTELSHLRATYSR